MGALPQGLEDLEPVRQVDVVETSQVLLQLISSTIQATAVLGADLESRVVESPVAQRNPLRLQIGGIFEDVHHDDSTALNVSASADSQNPELWKSTASSISILAFLPREGHEDAAWPVLDPPSTYLSGEGRILTPFTARAFSLGFCTLSVVGQAVHVKVAAHLAGNNSGEQSIAARAQNVPGLREAVVASRQLAGPRDFDLTCQLQRLVFLAASHVAVFTALCSASGGVEMDPLADNLAPLHAPEGYRFSPREYREFVDVLVTTRLLPDGVGQWQAATQATSGGKRSNPVSSPRGNSKLPRGAAPSGGAASGSRPARSDTYGSKGKRAREALWGTPLGIPAARRSLGLPPLTSAEVQPKSCHACGNPDHDSRSCPFPKSNPEWAQRHKAVFYADAAVP